MEIVEAIPIRVESPIELIAGWVANIRDAMLKMRTTAEKKIAVLW